MKWPISCASGVKGSFPPRDFVTIITNLIVTPVSLSVEVDFIFYGGAELLVTYGNVQALPTFKFDFFGTPSISQTLKKPSS
jgi:hypothetical protein